MNWKVSPQSSQPCSRTIGRHRLRRRRPPTRQMHFEPAYPQSLVPRLHAAPGTPSHYPISGASRCRSMRLPRRRRHRRARPLRPRRIALCGGLSSPIWVDRTADCRFRYLFRCPCRYRSGAGTCSRSGSGSGVRRSVCWGSFPFAMYYHSWVLRSCRTFIHVSSTAPQEPPVFAVHPRRGACFKAWKATA